MTFPSHTNRVCWMTSPLANQDTQLSRKGQGWTRTTRWLWRSTAISARLHPPHRRATKNTFSVLTPTSWLQQGSAFTESSGDTAFALKESWEKCSQGTYFTCLKGRAGRCSENQIPGMVHGENTQTKNPSSPPVSSHHTYLCLNFSTTVQRSPGLHWYRCVYNTALF